MQCTRIGDLQFKSPYQCIKICLQGKFYSKLIQQRDRMRERVEKTRETERETCAMGGRKRRVQSSVLIYEMLKFHGLY